MAKLRVLAEKPPMARGAPDNQLRELRDYLFRVYEELEYLLTHLDTDNLDKRLNALLDGMREQLEAMPKPSDDTPLMDGPSGAGVSTRWARGDHVHPEDTSKANQTQIAIVETGATASRAYVVGDNFVLNGLLYRTKTPISIGESFDEETNCEQTSVARMLRSVQMFRLSNETGTTSASGNLNLSISPNVIIVGCRTSAQQAVSFIGRGSNGNYYLHITDSSGNSITNTQVTVDVYYVDP